jgi:hypothetical protein
MDYVKALSQRLCDFKTELESCQALLKQANDNITRTLSFADDVSILLPPPCVQIQDIAEPMHTTKARGQGSVVPKSDKYTYICDVINLSAWRKRNQ